MACSVFFAFPKYYLITSNNLQKNQCKTMQNFILIWKAKDGFNNSDQFDWKRWRPVLSTPAWGQCYPPRCRLLKSMSGVYECDGLHWSSSMPSYPLGLTDHHRVAASCVEHDNIHSVNPSHQKRHIFTGALRSELPSCSGPMEHVQDGIQGQTWCDGYQLPMRHCKGPTNLKIELFRSPGI